MRTTARANNLTVVFYLLSFNKMNNYLDFDYSESYGIKSSGFFIAGDFFFGVSSSENESLSSFFSSSCDFFLKEFLD